MQPKLNQIILFEHGSYDGKTQVFDLNQYTPNAIHAFSGTALQDKASSVRWCLPEGRVATFANNRRYPQLPDLSELGRTIDLIGDGTVQEMNLTSRGIGDVLSAFFWRDVDPSRGHLIFYKDSDYRDYRQMVFLSEWAVNKVHSISNWAIQDEMSSVQWVNLDPNVVVELYDNSSGSGSSYRNIIRRKPAGAESGISKLRDLMFGSAEGIPSLSAVGMNDKISSFKIVEMLPVVEEIKSIEFDRREFPRKSVTIESDGSVIGTQAASIYTAQVENTWTESSSMTIEKSHTVGGSLSYQYASGTGQFGKHTVTVTAHYDYTQSRSDSASKHEEIKITHLEAHHIPPNHSWEFKLILRYDQIDTAFTSVATRWYDQPLLGTTMDTQKIPGRTLYRREEEVRGVLKGSFHFDTKSTFNANPI